MGICIFCKYFCIFVTISLRTSHERWHAEFLIGRASQDFPFHLLAAESFPLYILYISRSGVHMSLYLHQACTWTLRQQWNPAGSSRTRGASFNPERSLHLLTPAAIFLLPPRGAGRYCLCRSSGESNPKHDEVRSM